MQHGYAAWTSSMISSMDKQQGQAAWPDSVDIQVSILNTGSMDKQTGHDTQHGHEHVTLTYSMDVQLIHVALTCIMDMGMQRRHTVWEMHYVHVAWTMDIHHRHAAWRSSIDIQH